MDLQFTAEEEQFRQEVRDFLRTQLPAGFSDKVKQGQHLSKADMEQWHAILHARGWLANHWPKEYGGPDWTVFEKYIFEHECCLAHAPRVVPFGVNMLGPVLIKYGNQAQKDYWLPRILNGADWWCQGYSEPGSGSDLASLKTRAERDGDFYVVNGQKTWTTLAQHADMIFCLVRTDSSARKQEGISFLLIDMKTPGITVRPIIMLDEEHEVNEVFFDNVKVPVQNLIGEENKGWTYAKYLLGHERTNIAAVGRAKRELLFLKRIAGEHQKNGKPLIDDPIYAHKVASLEIELMALEITVLRVISQDSGRPGPEASLLKIKGTEIQQRLTELMLEAVGPYGLPFDPDFLDGETQHSIVNDDDAAALASYYFNYRKTSIYGGSNEIQKNIITQMILGL